MGYANVNDFDQNCLKHLKILENAETAANKMTTHKEADVEVAELKARYAKVKAVSDEWMKKADTLVKEWKLLDNTVNELNSWVPRIVVQNKNRTSPWKRWSPHWENSRISSRRRRDLSTICKNHIAFFVFMSPLPVTYFITKSRDYCDSRDLTILLNTIHSFFGQKKRIV